MQSSSAINFLTPSWLPSCSWLVLVTGLLANLVLVLVGRSGLEGLAAELLTAALSWVLNGLKQRKLFFSSVLSKPILSILVVAFWPLIKPLMIFCNRILFDAFTYLNLRPLNLPTLFLKQIKEARFFSSYSISPLWGYNFLYLRGSKHAGLFKPFIIPT